MNFNYKHIERLFSLPTHRDSPYRPRTRRRSAADTRDAAIAFAAAREVLG